MFDIKGFTIIFLLLFNICSIKYKSELRVKAYFCIQKKEVIYFSKRHPKHLLGDKCFVKEITNEQYSKYKNKFKKKP